MVVMANAIALLEQMGLLLSSISAMAACLLAVGTLSCIHAIPIVRCESAGTLCSATHGERRELLRLEIRVDRLWTCEEPNNIMGVCCGLK